MDPYISIGKESIEKKESELIDIFLETNEKKGNERRNINRGSTKPSRGLV